jgi:hypothetical protein
MEGDVSVVVAEIEARHCDGYVSNGRWSRSTNLDGDGKWVGGDGIGGLIDEVGVWQALV